MAEAAPAINSAAPITACVVADTSAIDAQVKELLTLFESAPEGCREDLASLFSAGFDRLVSDVVTGQLVTTMGADGLWQVVCPLRYGVEFERLFAAARAMVGKA